MVLQDSDSSGRKGSSYRDLAQVDPDTSGPKEYSYRDLAQVVPQGRFYWSLMQVDKQEPDTEILHKWLDRILIQVVQKDPHTEILHKWAHRIGPPGT